MRNSVLPVEILSNLYYDVTTKEGQPDYKTIEILSWLHLYREYRVGKKILEKEVIYNGLRLEILIDFVNPELYFAYVKTFGSTITSHLLAALALHNVVGFECPTVSTSLTQIQKYFNETRENIQNALDILKSVDLIDYKEDNNGLLSIKINFDHIEKLDKTIKTPKYKQIQELNNYYGVQIITIFECPHCYEELDSQFVKFIIEQSS